MDIKEKIQRAMHCGVQQKEIAAVAGIRLETVCRTYRGHTEPRKATEARITKAINSLLHDRTNLDGA